MITIAYLSLTRLLVPLFAGNGTQPVRQAKPGQRPSAIAAPEESTFPSALAQRQTLSHPSHLDPVDSSNTLIKSPFPHAPHVSVEPLSQRDQGRTPAPPTELKLQQGGRWSHVFRAKKEWAVEHSLVHFTLPEIKTRFQKEMSTEASRFSTDWPDRDVPRTLLVVVGGTDPGTENGGSPRGDQTAVEVLDFTNMEGGWETWSPLPEKRKRTCACSAEYNGRLYLFGGKISHGRRFSKACDVYVKAANKWAPLPDLPTPCTGAAAGVLRSDPDTVAFIVAGGYSGNKWVACTKKFSLNTNTWSTLPPMPTARSGGSGVVVGGRFFVVAGGYNGHQGLCLNVVEAFDTDKQAWIVLAPMLRNRTTCAIAACGSKVYIAGGYSGREYLASAEEYDIMTNTWRPLPDMPTARTASAGAFVNGRFIVVGGSNGATLKSVEAYDPIRGVWSRLPEMRTARWECTATAMH